MKNIFHFIFLGKERVWGVREKPVQIRKNELRQIF